MISLGIGIQRASQRASKRLGKALLSLNDCGLSGNELRRKISKQPGSRFIDLEGQSSDFTQLPGSLHAKQQNEEDKYIHVRSVEENPHRRKVCEPFYLTLCGDSCAIPARATPQSLSLQVGLEDDKSFAEPWAFADLNKVGRQERTKNLPLWGAWSE